MNVNCACRPAIPGVRRVIQIRNGAVASPKSEVVEGVLKSAPCSTQIGTRPRPFGLMLPFRHIWELHSHQFMPRPVTYNTLLENIPWHVSVLFGAEGMRRPVFRIFSCAAVLPV